jgi:hypothetical protein
MVKCLEAKCIALNCKKKRYSREGYCQMHNWRLKHYGDINYKRQIWRGCIIPECLRKHKGHGYCQFHLQRWKKGHSLRGELKTINPKRYKCIVQHEHPLAMKYGRVFLHRKVLFDSVNGSNLPCFWCGKFLYWFTIDISKKIYVDHYDHDRHNNNIENLLPSCNNCNAGRMKGYKKRLSAYG